MTQRSNSNPYFWQSSGPVIDWPEHTENAELTLGRSLQCDVVLIGPQISRMHAKVLISDGQYSLIDLDSGDGVWVNGQRCHRSQLYSGDRVEIGPYEWVYQVDAPTIVEAQVGFGLGQEHLNGLMSACSLLADASGLDQIAVTLTQMAQQFCAYPRAALFILDQKGYRLLHAVPDSASKDNFSRSLLSRATSGQVLELKQLQTSDLSQSMIKQELVSALAVGLAVGGEKCAVLMLDQRAGEVEAEHGHADFCLAIARLGEMAWAALEREQAAHLEREKIYRDLHDDLGARLLNLVFRAPNQALADEARDMLNDLRDLVSRQAQCSDQLIDWLADIHAELEARLAGSKIQMSWYQDHFDSMVCDAKFGIAISRMMRELTSNCIKHARPDWVKVRWLQQGQCIKLRFSHNGNESDPQQWRHGRGLNSLQSRAAAYAGHLNIDRAVCDDGDWLFFDFELHRPY